LRIKGTAGICSGKEFLLYVLVWPGDCTAGRVRVLMKGSSQLHKHAAGVYRVRRPCSIDAPNHPGVGIKTLRRQSYPPAISRFWKHRISNNGMSGPQQGRDGGKDPGGLEYTPHPPGIKLRGDR